MLNILDARTEFGNWQHLTFKKVYKKIGASTELREINNF